MCLLVYVPTGLKPLRVRAESSHMREPLAPDSGVGSQEMFVEWMNKRMSEYRRVPSCCAVLGFQAVQHNCETLVCFWQALDSIRAKIGWLFQGLRLLSLPQSLRLDMDFPLVTSNQRTERAGSHSRGHTFLKDNWVTQFTWQLLSG